MAQCMEDRRAHLGCGLIEALVAGVLMLWWVTLNNLVSSKAIWTLTLNQRDCPDQELSQVLHKQFFTVLICNVLTYSMQVNMSYQLIKSKKDQLYLDIY